MASGGIFTGANPGYKVFETVHHLRVCEAKFLITGLQSFETAKKAAEEVDIPESNVFVFNPNHEDIPPNSRSFWDLTTHGEAAWEPVSDAANVPCAYINSSGTSGLPKAVVIPHAYMTAQCALQTDRKLPYKVSSFINLCQQWLTIPGSQTDLPPSIPRLRRTIPAWRPNQSWKCDLCHVTL